MTNYTIELNKKRDNAIEQTQDYWSIISNLNDELNQIEQQLNDFNSAPYTKNINSLDIEAFKNIKTNTFDAPIFGSINDALSENIANNENNHLTFDSYAEFINEKKQEAYENIRSNFDSETLKFMDAYNNLKCTKCDESKRKEIENSKILAEIQQLPLNSVQDPFESALATLAAAETLHLENNNIDTKHTADLIIQDINAGISEATNRNNFNAFLETINQISNENSDFMKNEIYVIKEMCQERTTALDSLNNLSI